MKSCRSWLILPFLLSLVVSVIIYPECQPKEKWNGEWMGSKATIVTWFEKKQSGENDTVTKNLTIQYELQGQSSSKNIDGIVVSRYGAEVSQMRDDKTNISYIQFSEALDYGWKEFELSLVSGMVVLWSDSTRLVSLSMDDVIQKLTVKSSNVTVNCRGMDLVWTVSSGQTALIPIGSDDDDQSLSIFSNSEVQPILSLSNSNESLTLGTKGSSVADITQLQGQYRNSLPAFAEHRITLSCRHYIVPQNVATCSLLVGKQKLKLKTFSLKAMPKTLNIKSANEKEFKVFLHRPSPPPPTLLSPKSVKETPTVESGSSSGFHAVIGVLILACFSLVGTIAILFKQRRQRQEIVKIIADAVNMENQSLTDSSKRTSRGSISSFYSLIEPRMWEAVVSDDARQVEYLLSRDVSPYEAENRRETSAYMEAHILARKDILHLMFQYREEHPPIPAAADLIKPIINELEKRMKRVFRSARLGMYGREQGVKLLLQAFTLPATITDELGRSLVHYMAFASFIDGRPAWDAKDINDFFEKHQYLINAIDFWGSTPLHKMATRERVNSNQDIVLLWNGKETSLDDIWVDMAKIFLDHDCDPRIPDHRGLLAHQIAMENGHHELAALLKRKCDSLGKIDREAATDKFGTLAKAAGKGATMKLIELLKAHVPLLPICAHTDPLVEAIRCNQREAVFLLLSAGAPLTNQSIEDLTPLEAAHNTVDLPAFFPALMRKVYSDRLQAEQKKIPSSDDSYNCLQESMEDYKNKIIEHGCKTKWNFTHQTMEEKSKEARHLLTQAAELGLSLVCQLLSLENVYLHPLHREDKPFCKAAEHKQVYTQLALCRDLKMSPFTFTSSTIESLPITLREEILISQFRILERICEDPSNPFLHGESGLQVQQYVKNLKMLSHISDGLPETKELPETPDMLLYFIAENGLDAILCLLASKCKTFNINKVIDFSGSTLLHVASMNGRLNMIEFLIYHGARLDLTTIGGFTAAHVAAFSGHKESGKYIEKYMGSNSIDTKMKCSIGLTASDLMNQYTRACENLKLPLMSHEDTLHVLNEKGSANQAYEMLKRKGQILSIKNPEDLFRCVEENACHKDDMTDVLSIGECEAQKICKNLEKSDFEGKLLPVGPLQEEKELFNINDINFILEISKFHSVGHAPTVTCKNVNAENRSTLTIESKLRSELFTGTNFIQSFSKIMKTSITNYACLSSGISIAPPFLTTSLKGVCFYLIIKRKQIFTKIAVHLVPVIAVNIPDGSRLDTLPQEFGNSHQINVHVHLCNAQRGEWFYRPYHFENFFFRTLTGNERKVWMACRLIRKLISPYSWAPRFDTKRYIKPWHTLSVGVPFHQPRAIKTLFLSEREDKTVKWGENDLFERLSSIYTRAARKDEFGNWISQPRIPSFVNPHYYLDGKDIICGILKYLENLQEEKDHG